MKTRAISSFLRSLLLVSVIIGAVVYNMNKPKLMILQSYHKDYSWTHDVDQGLMRILKHAPSFNIVKHYMDTKKHKDKQWLRKAGIIARQAIDKWKPDVLIAVDNLAQELAAKYYVDHPDIKIVFAGINGSIEPYGYHTAKNVTGILENRPCHALRELILSIKKKDPESGLITRKKDINLIYLRDASFSVQADNQYIKKFDWTPLNYTGDFVARSFSEWKDKVLNLDNSIDYIFVTNYRQLARSKKDIRFVPPKEVIEWTQTHSKVPIIGLNPFNVADGCILSVGVSPYEQGETAARMAKQLLKKEKRIADLRIVENRQFIISMRKSAISRRGIILPDVYETFCRATNTYYE